MLQCLAITLYIFDIIFIEYSAMLAAHKNNRGSYLWHE